MSYPKHVNHELSAMACPAQLDEVDLFGVGAQEAKKSDAARKAKKQAKAEARRVDAATCRAIEEFDSRRIRHSNACGATPIGGLLVAAKRHGRKYLNLDFAAGIFLDLFCPGSQHIGMGPHGVILKATRSPPLSRTP